MSNFDFATYMWGISLIIFEHVKVIVFTCHLLFSKYPHESAILNTHCFDPNIGILGLRS